MQRNGSWRGLAVVLGLASVPVPAAVAMAALARAIHVPVVPEFLLTFALVWIGLTLPFTVAYSPDLPIALALSIAAVQWSVVGVLVGRVTRKLSWFWVFGAGAACTLVVGTLVPVVMWLGGAPIKIEWP